jgi:hypothetical protein
VQQLFDIQSFIFKVLILWYFPILDIVLAHWPYHLTRVKLYLLLIYHPMGLMGPTKSNPHFVNGSNGNVVTNLIMFMLLGFMFFDIHHKIYKNSWYPCEEWAPYHTWRNFLMVMYAKKWQLSTFCCNLVRMVITSSRSRQQRNTMSYPRQVTFHHGEP